MGKIIKKTNFNNSHWIEAAIQKLYDRQKMQLGQSDLFLVIQMCVADHKAANFIGFFLYIPWGSLDICTHKAKFIDSILKMHFWVQQQLTNIARNGEHQQHQK